MSKLAGLRAAHELLTISRNTCARGHLLEWKRHPDDKPYQEALIETSFLLVEIEDLIQSLEAIAEVCQHVLAGTVPIDHYLDPAAFDPWAAIDALLNDEFLMPVYKLSPRLTAWLEARPQAEQQSTRASVPRVCRLPVCSETASLATQAAVPSWLLLKSAAHVRAARAVAP